MYAFLQVLDVNAADIALRNQAYYDSHNIEFKYNKEVLHTAFCLFLLVRLLFCLYSEHRI